MTISRDTEAGKLVHHHFVFRYHQFVFKYDACLIITIGLLVLSINCDSFILHFVLCYFSYKNPWHRILVVIFSLAFLFRYWLISWMGKTHTSFGLSYYVGLYTNCHINSIARGIPFIEMGE